MVVRGLKAYYFFGFLITFRNCSLFLGQSLSSLTSALRLHVAEMRRLVRRPPKQRLPVGLDVFEFAVASLKHALFDAVSSSLLRHCCVEFWSWLQVTTDWWGRGQKKERALVHAPPTTFHKVPTLRQKYPMYRGEHLCIDGHKV